MSPSGTHDLAATVLDEPQTSSTGTAGDSILVSVCTLGSRVTGVLKVAAIGAVLGPTFFGNTFQLTNTLPNLIYYGFLAGSLFSSLLVPALVGHLDAGDRRAAERVAGGFLGLTLVALLAVLPIAVAFGPLLLRAVGPGAAAQSGAQEHLGRLLIAMFLPQLFCYAVVGTATAAMNARQRFALGAVAPALENLGIVAVLGLTQIMYGGRITVGNVPPGELLLLGFGTTGAVVLHASLQWWGAHRTGLTLVPRGGWRDPEVRALLRLAAPAVAQAGLVALQVLTLLALANRRPGGVIAFQIALNFYYLAIALGATPVALSVLPRLARLDLRKDLGGFRDTLARGLSLGFFVAVPAMTGYLVLARPIARAVSVGRMGTANGIAMVAAAVVPLAVAVVAQTAFSIASYASYARRDTTGPMRSMVLQAVCCLGIAGFAIRAPGTWSMTVLGTAFAAAITVGAGYLLLRLRRRLGRADQRVLPSLLKIGLGAAVMAVPAGFTAQVVGAAVKPPLGSASAVFSAVLVGVGVFVASQFAFRTEELGWFAGGALRLLARRNRTPIGADHA